MNKNKLKLEKKIMKKNVLNKSAKEREYFEITKKISYTRIKIILSFLKFSTPICLFLILFFSLISFGIFYFLLFLNKVPASPSKNTDSFNKNIIAGSTINASKMALHYFKTNNIFVFFGAQINNFSVSPNTTLVNGFYKVQVIGFYESNYDYEQKWKTTNVILVKKNIRYVDFIIKPTFNCDDFAKIFNESYNNYWFIHQNISNKIKNVISKDNINKLVANNLLFQYSNIFLNGGYDAYYYYYLIKGISGSLSNTNGIFSGGISLIYSDFSLMHGHFFMSIDSNNNLSAINFINNKNSLYMKKDIYFLVSPYNSNIITSSSENSVNSNLKYNNIGCFRLNVSFYKKPQIINEIKLILFSKINFLFSYDGKNNKNFYNQSNDFLYGSNNFFSIKNLSSVKNIDNNNFFPLNEQNENGLFLEFFNLSFLNFENKSFKFGILIVNDNNNIENSTDNPLNPKDYFIVFPVFFLINTSSHDSPFILNNSFIELDFGKNNGFFSFAW